MTVAVPSLATTTALAWLAISAASTGEASQQSARVKSAIAVSPAPETSKTWRALRRDVMGRLVALEQHHALLA